MTSIVFRLDADGVHDVEFQVQAQELRIGDRVTVAGIYVVGVRKGPRMLLQNRHAALVQAEQARSFDPAGN